MSKAIYCQNLKINVDEPATVLGTGDTRMNMIDMSTFHIEITLYDGMQAIIRKIIR